MLNLNSNGKSEIDFLIDSLFELAKKASCSDEVDYTVESLAALSVLRGVKPVWSLDLVTLEDFENTRTQNIIGGRPFTSEQCPWPVDAEGIPLYPLIQLNLEQISNLTGNDFGSGLLQVWINIQDDDNWMTNVVRVIELDEMHAPPTPVEFNSHEINPKGEFSEGFSISFSSLGYMCSNWEGWQLECNSDRSFSHEEEELIHKIELIAAKNNYTAMSGDWLLGFPDNGSGSPAGSYSPEPENLIQFASYKSFPLVAISKYANVFYSKDESTGTFWFDWNG